VGRRWDVLGERIADGDPVGIPLQILSIVAIALPVLATVYLVVRIVRRTAAGVWRSTEGRPVRRATAVLAAVAVVAALAWAWWPRPDTYIPVRATERGTVLTGIGEVAQASGFTRLTGIEVGGRSTTLDEGQTGTAQTLWADPAPPPAKDEPALAVVLVPSDPEAEAPTWVFPFDRPDAPGVGDNQALAVNTADGTTLYDVAFALVWADGSSVLNTNEAYAFASCTDCTTVAVGFQVVLVLGQADVVIPQNLSAAVNYACISCVTYALAQQLVLTVPGDLSPAAMARLEALWAEIEQFGRSLRDVPLAEVQARLVEFERQIVAIVADDRGGATRPAPTTTPSSSPSSSGSTPAPSTSATAQPSGSAGTGAGQAPTGSSGSSGSPAPTASSSDGSGSGTSGGTGGGSTATATPSPTGTATTAP
jgi:putative peptide zinc metalloprotease protein